MAVSRTKSNAQQARDNYRAARIKQWTQSRQAEVLEPPIFPPDSVEDTADGTLNKDVLLAPVSIGFSPWTALPPTAAAIATIELRWAEPLADGSAPPVPADQTDTTVYRQIAEKEVSGPLTPADFPIDLDIPLTSLAVDGKFYLLLVMQPYNGQPYLFSVPVPVTLDSAAPYGAAKPMAMTVNPPGPITDAYLTANGDKVTAEIAEYPDYQEGDKVSFFWTAAALPDDWSGETPIGRDVPITAPPWPFKVEYPEAGLRLLADGTWHLGYGLADKATNKSISSTDTSVIMALGTLPSGMVDPIVPLAIAPDVLDLKDAIAGVNVQIDDFQNHKPTDEIIVTWGTTELPGEPIGTQTFPLHIEVPPDVLKATYGTGTGPVDTNVSYVVDRGGLKSPASSTTIKVDFFVVGPPNPDIWPTPVNTTLPLARIYGAESLTENVLTRLDEGKDASLRVMLYRNLKPGEYMDFYWKGVVVPSAQYQIKSTDTDTTEAGVYIPWEVIKEGFNDPALPVHYRISAAEGFEDNEQHSQNTEVNADAVTPVGPEPKFLGGQVGGGNVIYLNCDSLWDVPPYTNDPAIRVEVPDLSQKPLFLPDGTVIKMKWRVVDDLPPHDPISDLDFDEEIILGTDYPRTGFVWRVPYADYIEPLYDLSQDGTARVSYSFMLGTEEVFSPTVNGNVSMHTGLVQCPLTPPPRKKS
jgi:hypothetical protein